MSGVWLFIFQLRNVNTLCSFYEGEGNDSVQFIEGVKWVLKVECFSERCSFMF